MDSIINIVLLNKLVHWIIGDRDAEGVDGCNRSDKHSTCGSKQMLRRSQYTGLPLTRPES